MYNMYTLHLVPTKHQKSTTTLCSDSMTGLVENISLS